MPEALLDIPKLSMRIKELAMTYKPSKTTELDKNDESFEALSPIIRRIVLETITKEDSYWKAAGIRTVDGTEFADCLEKVVKKGKILGEGYYGKVYDVRSNACIKNIPKGLKHVGIKIEQLKKQYNSNQRPERLLEVIEIATKAGKLGIGPHLYDAFITHDSIGNVQIVKVFEIINGNSWEHTVWKSEEKKHAAALRLSDAILKMNEAGIIHHDLHAGNVMVDKNGKVYIIDYDRAKFVKNEEKQFLADFNATFPSDWEPTGAASPAGVRFIYDSLVSEGAIKTGATNQVRKTRRASRRQDL